MSKKSHPTHDWTRGAELAIEFLEAHEGDADTMTIDPTFHMGRPQQNAALPFLERVMREPHLLPGFASVLTDFLSAAMSGGVRDVCDIETDVSRLARCKAVRS